MRKALEFWLDILEMSSEERAKVTDQELVEMSAAITDEERRVLVTLRRVQRRRQRFIAGRPRKVSGGHLN